MEYLRLEFVDSALASAVRDSCDAALSSSSAGTDFAAAVVAANCNGRPSCRSLNSIYFIQNQN